MTQQKYKNWVFTWNANIEGKVVDVEILEQFCTENFNLYVFQEEVGEETHRRHIQGCFQTKIRKRQSTLLNEFKAEFGDFITYLTINRMCGDWDENYAYCTKEETRAQDSVIRQSSSLQEYEAKDLDLFRNEGLWYNWQMQLFAKLFEKYTSCIKVPDDREIMWITDKEGNSGKSKFTKYLCTSNSDIIKLPFGSAAQIRSAAINAGTRKMYIIDIPRVIGEDDSLISLISSIEDIKNGFVVSSMYGKYQSLIMEPPHIVVFSNMDYPKSLLSKDRWTPFHITKNMKTLIPYRLDEGHPGNGFSTFPYDIEEE